MTEKAPVSVEEAQGSETAWLRRVVDESSHLGEEDQVNVTIGQLRALTRPDPSLGSRDPYTVQSFADLRSQMESFERNHPDFPNYGDWPIPLPAGHWRAINAALSKPSPPSLGMEEVRDRLENAVGETVGTQMRDHEGRPIVWTSTPVVDAVMTILASISTPSGEVG